MLKKAMILLAAAMLAMFVAGCNKTEDNKPSETPSATASATPEATATPTPTETPVAITTPTPMDPAEGIGAPPEGGYAQLNGPKAGDTIAVMETNMGTIKIRLFPEYAPKAVENFVTHAQTGYYEGVIFHRVIDNFMIQSGDPTGTGTGGESIWGTPFEDEFSPQLHNIRGALSMANHGQHTNGSQFFIVQNYDAPEGIRAERDSWADFPAEAEWVEDAVKKGRDLHQASFNRAYEEIGGTPHLDYFHSVFGQVYEGMDVVDAIANVPTVMGSGGTMTKPAEDVVILKITIGTYE